MKQHLYTNEPAPQPLSFAPQPHTSTVATDDPLIQQRIEQTREDYLDHVCLPLVDSLSYAARQELRRELTPHLQSLADAYVELGYPPLEAMERALVKFGPPEVVAQQWRPAQPSLSRSRGERVKRWLRRQWPGMAVTLSACGAIATVLLLNPATPPRTEPVAERVQTASTAQFAPQFHHNVVLRDHVACTECHSGAPSRATERQFAVERAQRWMAQSDSKKAR